jgi:hypothetical protein
MGLSPMRCHGHQSGDRPHAGSVPSYDKRLMKQTAIAFLITLIFTSAAMAQQAETPAEEKVEEVKVTGLRDADFKTYRIFMLGLDAFDKHQALAPTAPLRFMLRPLDDNAKFDGVTMRIAGAENSIPVPIAADGTFAMPRDQAMADEDAEILLNRKKGLFRWRALVKSPGVPEDKRRLGDLRLECKVRWAVERSEMPLYKRTILGAFGDPCTSRMVNVFQLAPPNMSGAYMVIDGKRVKLSTTVLEKKFHVYIAPLGASAGADDNMIEFEFNAAKS